MEHWNEIGFQVNRLAHLIHCTVNQTIGVPVKGDRVVTDIQGRIMDYLYENRDRDVFQRDVQEQFAVTRSTVTGNLQLMEKNGLITRTSVAWDARLKKLELTPKALRMHESVTAGIRRTEERISSALTPEERETFLRLCEKIRDGIGPPEARETEA